MTIYTFPFNTCEIPSPVSGIAQPWSFAINLLSTIILGGLATYFQNVAILSYCVFELFHTFSHAVHLPGRTQHFVAHFLGYVIALSTWWELRRKTGKDVPQELLLFLIVVMLFDLYVLFFVGGVWTIFFGLLLLTLIFITYLDSMPPISQRLLGFLIIGVLILFILFLNESYNCQKMLKKKKLPYHALIEILGLILFIGLSILVTLP